MMKRRKKERKESIECLGQARKAGEGNEHGGRKELSGRIRARKKGENGD